MLNLSLSNYSKVTFNVNTLFYGDNLEILKHLIPDESIDLIYLDPPFNSKADYNILFKEDSGDQSTAQIQAFSDFWHWDIQSRRAYEFLTGNEVDSSVANLAMAIFQLFGKSDMSAYLFMMAVRLIELKRVLKSSGSIFLHCDPSASHYLKLLMDSIFGIINFRNEIIWKRTSAHSGDVERFGRIHDVILFYTASDGFKFKPIHMPYDEKYIQSHYRYIDKDDAAIGIFLTFENPTSEMIREIKATDPYVSQTWNHEYSKIQILTIQDLLSGKRPEIPPTINAFQEAPLSKRSANHRQETLFT